MNTNELSIDARDCASTAPLRIGAVLEWEKTLFVIINLLDVLLTFTLISTGSFIESNPVADYFIANWGILGMSAFKLILVAMVLLIANLIALKRLSTARSLLNFGSLVTGLVVAYSSYLLSAYLGII